MKTNIHHSGALLTLLAGLILLALSSAPAGAATTFTVNKTSDGGDRRINGRCDASSVAGGQCTLRAAIQEANATPGADTIEFAIGGTATVKTISPTRPLPSVTESVTIDGYSQGSTTETTSDDAKPNDNPFVEQGTNAVIKVQLTGTNAGARANGLKITASDSTIRGLAINRFARSGVLVQGSGVTGNKVEGNFLGTSASGTQDLGNAIDGVRISGGPTNTIGGSQPAQSNVVSGNGRSGVAIWGSGAADNSVWRNFIGTDASGSQDLGNSSDGVFVGGAPDNTVGVRWDGGEFVGAGNIVSGNDSDGIAISGLGATGNSVQRNGIGILLRNNGTEMALGNSDHGVHIQGASDNVIGDTAAGNEIAKNGGDGVYVASGTGNRILDNSIHSNGGLGIDLGPDGVTDNDVDPTGPGDDADTGANGLQNAPTITSTCYSVPYEGTYTVISGTLNSTPSQNFDIYFFEAYGFADPSNHGEGGNRFASTGVTTDANGDAYFEVWVPGFPPPLLTATATNTSIWDTSEFSENAETNYNSGWC